MTHRGRTALALFVFFHALYALTSSGNAFRIPDEFEVYFQTEHLVDAGDISVPQTLDIRSGQQSIFFGKVGLDGKPYAPYGPLAAVLAVPHHLAGRALASALGIERKPRSQGGFAWGIFVGGITMLTSATAAALAVAGFYRAVTALGTPLRPALWLSLMLGGASVLWPYAKSFYSEAWQAALLIWAAAWLLEARAGERPHLKIAGAAILLALMGLTKQTSLVFAPAFVIAAMAETSIAQKRRVQVAASLSAGIALATLGHLWWNDYRFGAIFDFGYDWSETIPVLPPRAFELADIPRGALVLLATPGKSLLLWAPILVLAALSVTRAWRQDRALTTGVLAVFGVSFVFYAAYLFPEGGYAHGPRNLVPIVPLVALLAGGPGADQFPRAAWMGCAAIGVVMALLAVSVSSLVDQALRRNQRGEIVEGYYELVEPAPGRASNRYRIDYIPFVMAMTSPGWWTAPGLGQGPDFMVRYLDAARQVLPDGGSIPQRFTLVWSLLWLVVLIAGGVVLQKGTRGLTGGEESHWGSQDSS